MVTANRTLINEVLYTSEDPPEMVLISVPVAVRPNGTAAQQYFSFGITYSITLEAFFEGIILAKSSYNLQTSSGRSNIPKFQLHPHQGILTTYHLKRKDTEEQHS